MGGIRYRALALAGLSTCLLSAACAEARRPGEMTFDMPRQNLGTSLRAVAALTRLSIAAPSELVDSRQAPALSGEFTAADAIARLLKDSGLHAEQVGGTIIVRADGDRVAGTTAAPLSSDDDVVITGTRIRGAAPIGSELITINRAAIDQSGYATTQQILQSLPQSFGGGPNQGTSNFTDRNGSGVNFALGASVNLRGLGPTSTLVLIDGNRPALGGGGTAVDLSMIPSNAIDRIEVLADGASAIYGSDAVAGVVNVRLRDNFEGAETRFRQGFANGFSETQASQLFGKRWRTGHITIGYEYYRQGRLAAADRPYITEDLRPFGGPDYRKPFANPGTIIAVDGQKFAIPKGQDGTHLSAGDLVAGTQNLGDGRAGSDALPNSKRQTAYADFSQELSSSLKFTLRGFYGERRATDRYPPLDNGVTVPTTNAFYVDPVGSHQPVTVDYNFGQDLGAETAHIHVTDASLEAGLVATVGQWSADLHGNFGAQRETERTANRVNTFYLAQALADPDPATAFNVFGDGSHTNPQTIDKVRGWVSQTGLSHVWSTSFKLDGPLLRLPAGQAQLAVGGEYRHEHYAYHGIDFVSGAAPVDAGTSGFPQSRSIGAGYAELRVPLVDEAMAIPALRRLDLSIAGRIERYSDAGWTRNPKIGLSWLLVPGVGLRASYGTSFRAPGLGDKRQGSDFSQQAPLPLADPQSPTGTTNVLALFGNNPDIGPERARTWTAGIDAHPDFAPGVTANLTYFDVAYRDRIANPAENAFTFLQDRSRYASLINDHPDPALIAAYYAANTFINPFGIAASSVTTIIDARIANLARQEEQGIDFDLGYRFGGKPTRFELGVSGTKLFSLSQWQLAGAASTQVVSTLGYPVDLRLRGRALAIAGRFDAALFANYIDHYKNEAVRPVERIASWTTIDLQIGYRPGFANGVLKGLRLSVSATNLFDRKPPYANVTTILSASGYDAENASPIGRLVAFQVIKPW